MKSILIDITNACDKSCSNCTRFCGNHKKPYFMSYETFTRAVDSLLDHNGTIGIMGGEPTLHPEFERFMLYLQGKLGNHPGRSRMIRPIKDFVKENLRRDWECSRVAGDGGHLIYREYGARLFSHIGKTYKKYYELIADTCNKQVLDDHVNPVYHQPGLIARKDLGIPDSDWIRLRDACWIQDEWCATVTPKGAFFCEIAAGLDMLFDGPGGWPIEENWWRRSPEEFGRQPELCELCGFALNTFTRDSSEGIDDVSPTLYRMLEKIGGPKIKSGRINQVKIENGRIAEESKRENKRFSSGMPYLEHYGDRFSAVNSILYASDFDIFDIADGADFGRRLNEALRNSSEWIILSRDAVPNELLRRLKTHVLNPGALLFDGNIAVLSRNALSLRRIGFDRIAHMESFNEIKELWQQNKIINLDTAFDAPVGLKSNVENDKRYVIWGTGMAGDQSFDAIESAGAVLAFVVDKSESKHGESFHGAVVESPATLTERQNEFDYIVCANYNHTEEIRQQALELGVRREKLLLIGEI
jgi:hypothetical protein